VIRKRKLEKLKAQGLLDRIKEEEKVVVTEAEKQ
jgi:hypothetical protein